MEIGLKIYPEDLDYAKKLARYCDFFEVTAIPGSDFRKLKLLGKPFTIHTIHSKWGFNTANPEKESTINRKGISVAEDAADILDADTIVVHPGYLESAGCSITTTIKTIRRLDKRFAVENLPPSTKGFVHVGCSLKELHKILSATKKRLCLDFPHAAEFAYQNGLDYTHFIKRLMRFSPEYFHISDTNIQDKRDLHLHLKEGDLRLDYFKDILPKDARVVLETAHEFRKQHKDIQVLRD
ncbi:MAG: TIM barrel protein [Candidatus Woesearchaeota archaeon]